ncbi:CO(2)-response secreted protease [Hevea brasiliensis]|uniref:CO(2)-response secreted protease n=1 Tax=Hevea brasiliensis TaxID=3981 RepID=UPI0025D93BB4|nr:CO(2)-response secreted protease [Hevea brasiliensis]
MNGLIIFYLLFPLSCLIETGVAAADKDGVYIVYMGAGKGYLENDYVQLLSSVSKGKKNAILRSYRHGFSGFAARLSEAEAQSIAQRPGVASVFPDPVFQLHTTRSWDFLKYQTDVEIDSNPTSDSSSSFNGSDTIIGIIDTGIWPESESFSDKDMGPILSRWKGTCVKGYNFNSSNCNRKLIGARFYGSEDDEDDEIYQTPRDMIGHGTHVAATAAGAVVSSASYYGLAEGTAKGGSPGSRIAVYRVCSQNGCQGSSILAAFDDAIADGADVLSISLGSPSSFASDLNKDPIAIGAFHATENGITVVCSAGNDGPTSGTVVNTAPWILTVGATTIDRDFESDVVLGGNKAIKGEGINFANIGRDPVHPLIYAKSANNTDSAEDEARNCKPGSMDKEKIKGNIILCDNEDGEYSDYEKKGEVQSLGGIGLILVDDKTKAVASIYKEFPMTVISSKDAAEILSYINSTKNPVATILPTTAVTKYKPAPAVAYFSARGPSSIIRNILKPDIAAPGVDIIAAWMGNDTQETVKGKEPPLFNVLSGTSMACPHVSGIAAAVKSQNPTWSPSAIKSAIMTTASQTNNVKASITADSGAIATAYDYGAGEISATGPLQPGLVYETTVIDYLNFLCHYGYDTSTIKVISATLPDGFTCPKDSSSDLISNINYPSIAVFNLAANQIRNVSRTLTNVGGDGATSYTPMLSLPRGLGVAVDPMELKFTGNGQRLSYQVFFNASSPLDDVFGSITWTNGKFKVRTPFVVSSRSSKK